MSQTLIKIHSLALRYNNKKTFIYTSYNLYNLQGYIVQLEQFSKSHYSKSNAFNPFILIMRLNITKFNFKIFYN